jgi:D-beta-D-heptose 7-phosphate kinase/D-beta-D-heptose 1-phosphate adenosyltransferase
MNRPGIVVVGDSLLDCDVEGIAERLSPDAPVPVLEERTSTTRPGGAALTASLAARDGESVTLVTALGEDAAAEELRGLLVHVGVQIIRVTSGGPTPEKIRLLAGRQPLLRLDRGGAPTRVGRLPDGALRAISEAGIVVVSDYGRGMTGREELAETLRQRRRPTLWDPHPRGNIPVAQATLVTPNLSELRSAFPGTIDGMHSIVERTATARRRWRAQSVVTTLGVDGAVLVDGDGPPLVVPARAAATGDPCGAGDRFITSVAALLLHGCLLSEAVTEAVDIAGRFVADGGARALSFSHPRPSRAGIAAAAGSATLDRPAESLPGAATTGEAGPPSAERLAASVHAGGRRLVVAGGCFDLLHAGHAALLESARRLGDCLIVALNSDASVRRLKGPGRPVVTQRDRAALLNALACVDAVAVFDDDTPDELLRRLQPSIFAKGGDYSARVLPEAAILEEWGGQAVVLPYLSGRFQHRPPEARRSADVTTRPRLLALRALGLGDILTGIPAFRALSLAFPGYHRVIVAPATFASLLLGEGLADEICDSHELAPIDPTQADPDIAVDLHGRGPGSQPLLLAMRPRRLIAFAHPDIPETAGFPQWRPGEHEAHRWCRMLSESGIPADPRKLDINVPPGPVAPSVPGATLIHPGAASNARRWPPERFAAVARSEIERGHEVVVTGNVAETALATHVATLARIEPDRVLAGSTDLQGLIRVVAAAGRVVCGDTGVAHLATAVGTPSVVLFGPVPPSEWGPPSSRPKHRSLWTGRRGDPHGAWPDPGLLQITVADVEAALDGLHAEQSTYF